MSDLTHEEFQAAARVVAGNPTAEELAAAMAVLELALAQEQELGGSPITKSRSTWSQNASQLRADIVPGKGQWRAAARNGLR